MELVKIFSIIISIYFVYFIFFKPFLAGRRLKAELDRRDAERYNQPPSTSHSDDEVENFMTNLKNMTSELEEGLDNNPKLAQELTTIDEATRISTENVIQLYRNSLVDDQEGLPLEVFPSLMEYGAQNSGLLEVAPDSADTMITAGIVAVGILIENKLLMLIEGQKGLHIVRCDSFAADKLAVREYDDYISRILPFLSNHQQQLLSTPLINSTANLYASQSGIFTETLHKQ